jgi:hypothetical protein
MIRPALIVLILSLGVCTLANSQQTSPSPFVLDEGKKEVTRQDAKGKVIWSVTFKEAIGGVRPPHLLWDEQRVYLTHNGGVTALDFMSKTVWHAAGPRNGLLLSDGLLLGTGSVPSKDDSYSHWLFACDVAKGTIVFKTELAQEMSDPEPVQEVAGLFLVQILERPGGGCALLIDRQGAIRHQFDRQVVCAKPYGGDVVFLTSKNIVRVTPKDKIVWTVPFDQHQWIAGGELIDLPGGDVIASQFGRICDSGVSLIRFDPTSGKAKWKAYCQGLHVGHSAYLHSASVTVKGGKLQVTSKGSYGTFVEMLDLKTGSHLQRTQKKP